MTRRALLTIGLIAAACGLLTAVRELRGGLWRPASPLQTALAQPAVKTVVPRVPVKVTLGLEDSEPTSWDGIAHVDRGRIVSIQGWTFSPHDQELIEIPKGSWRAKSKKPNFDTSWRSVNRPLYGSRPTRPLGILLELDSPPDATLSVHTVQGDFETRLDQLTTGRAASLLNNRVRIEAMAPSLPVAHTEAQEDYPSLAAGPDGRLYAGWIAYQGGGDTLMYGVLGDDAAQARKVVDQTGIYGANLLVGDARGRMWSVYSRLESNRFDLWARQIVPSAGEPVRLTNAGNNINPSTARAADGTIWLVWQSLREGNSDVYAMCAADFTSRPREIRVTEDARNDWLPGVAINPSGDAVVVWDTYRNGDYDIYMRSVSRAGRLGPETPVSATPNYEANACAVFDPQGRLWIAWEESGPHWGKDNARESSRIGTLLHSDRRIQLKCWQNGAWFRLEKQPQTVFRQLPLNFQEQPELVVDRGANIWLVFRQWVSRQDPYEVWNIYATRFDGAEWSEPIPLPRSDGRLTQGAPAAAHPDGSVWVAYATDYRGAGLNLTGRWDVYAARLGPVPAAQAAPRFVQVDPDTPATRYVPTPNKHYETKVGTKTYRLYFGDLHRHTDIVGHGYTDPSISGQYRYALDAAELDFMGTTDHSQTYANTADVISALDEYGWWRTQKVADMYLFSGRFASIYGYERSMVKPGGHRNIFWRDRKGELIPGDTGIPSDNIPLGLWRRLRQTDGISIPHTPNGPYVSWEWHDPESQPVMELYQGFRSSYEYAGALPEESRGFDRPAKEPGHYLWDALARGHRIGVIGSSDHESTHMSYAAVYTSDVTRDGIFEGLKSRRTFAATDNIVVDFRIGDAFMGEEINLAQPPQVEVRILGTGPVRQVDIVKDGRFIYTARPQRKDVTVSYIDLESRPGATSYYYARVIQEDEMMAWSSAIWVNRK